MVWNVTYGTYRDPDTIKQTDNCNPSQLSSQTWSVTRPMEVLRPRDSGTAVIKYNLSTVKLTPRPTGLFLLDTSVNGTSGQGETSGGGAPGESSGGLAVAGLSIGTLISAWICAAVVLVAV